MYMYNTRIYIHMYIEDPPFPILKAEHSVSYSCICDVCTEWVNEVGFFLKIPVWLVYYARFSCTCTQKKSAC